MRAPILVEACVDSIEAALAAARGGAHRIELCANLVEGGRTPSTGTLAVCRARLGIPIFVLIRPRARDPYRARRGARAHFGPGGHRTGGGRRGLASWSARQTTWRT